MLFAFLALFACSAESGSDTQVPTTFSDAHVASVNVALSHYCATDLWGHVSCASDGIPELLVPDELKDVRFTDLSVSNDYSCAVRLDDKSVVCWGDTEITPSPPEDTFKSISSIVEMYSSLDYSCGVTSEGDVECWGNTDDKSGVVGGSSLVDLGAASDICIGGHGTTSFVCVQDAEENTVSCWGVSAADEGWNAAFNSAASAGPIIAGTLTCNREQACGILDDGSGTVDCWGSEWDADSNPEVVSMADTFGTVVGPFGSGFVTVSAGPHFNCAVRPDGEAECFGGKNSDGSFPDEAVNHKDNLALENAFWTQLSVSENGGCGVDLQSGDPKVECWGDMYSWAQVSQF